MAPLLATVATAACAPLIGQEAMTPVPLGPPGWRTARAAYGADPRQALRLYRPAAANRLPILILLPDGAPEAADERAARDLAEGGFIVVLADRRAAPGSPHPAFISDAATVVVWAAKRAQDSGGDAERIGVLGLGEGGRAALMLALDRRYLAAAGAPAAVRAAAALGAYPGPDATFTDPSAYGGASGSAPVWRGAAGDLAGAVAFLREALA
ncbi:alpha/beta hydrolase fold domain-containing protein [Brevundimonas diminuta]|uniref:alpha/beta hydrolase n=1 Tax=Brevundimonas diminuta TaxID=293 RepID=UPI002097B10B|nr:alpha/beta hydrolase fold domain-containing protein [Brevundimonas diminuta]MCO8018316.1 alpha/beta hydrolase fold domain-containing protein [Brevundimonas diminuta]MCO8022160.1 alpha/beta hydrolase fold domain-containing protein [Brevundimonas diminuta]